MKSWTIISLITWHTFEYGREQIATPAICYFVWLEIVGYVNYFILHCLELQNSIKCDGVHNASLPVSVAEIWLNSIGRDIYDVTLFNGFNLPVTIAPTVINPPKFHGLP